MGNQPARVTRVAIVVLWAALLGCGASKGSPDAAPPSLDAAVDAAPPATLHILAFNDFHGALDSASAAGGAAYLAGEIKARDSAGTVVVSAGDLVGGSPLDSGLFHDEPAIEIMNAIGLDYAGVGNHEFDEGTPELLRLQHGGCHPVDGCTPGQTFAGASFPFLAANVRYTATGATILPPYALRDIDGVKVGFIGMTLRDTPAVTLPSAVADLTFDDEVATVHALLPEMHAAGAQVIIVLLHQGGGQAGGFDDCAGLVGPIVDIAHALDGEVAMIASGHSHAMYNCTIGNVIVTSAGAHGQALTDATLQIDRATGAVVSANVHNVLVTTAATPDPAVAAIVASYDALAEPIANQPVATITATLSSAGLGGESAMGDVITDAMLEGTASAGAQVALMNTGGIRAELSYPASAGEASDGIVRYAEAFAVQPFSNTVSTVTLSGADLVAALDAWSTAGKPVVVAGLTYTQHASAPAGSRVTAGDVAVGGVALDPLKAYRVTANSIVRSPISTPSMANATNEVGAGVDLDLLIAYLGTHQPVAPPPQDRITVVP
ncbi:MAG: bifunctional metallophosphatase/5'-nucleotidase [Deltaproteobacteria bacterium]|nr:bifunctional metallophosphatase/5'-nucleotidase [Deltaproteobacteria bacterium]